MELELIRELVERSRSVYRNLNYELSLAPCNQIPGRAERLADELRELESKLEELGFDPHNEDHVGPPR